MTERPKWSMLVKIKIRWKAAHNQLNLIKVVDNASSADEDDPKIKKISDAGATVIT